MYSLLKNKAKIIEMYEGSVSLVSKKNGESPYGEINDLYLLAVRKNVVPDGPTLVNK